MAEPEVTVRAAWVPVTGVVYYTTDAVLAFPEGTTALGSFKHHGAADTKGHEKSHVLINHIQDLLYKVKEYNMQRITLLPAPVPAPEPDLDP